MTIQLADQVNRGAVNQAVQDGMNSSNSDILAMSLEMTGKGAVISESTGQLHAIGTKADALTSIDDGSIAAGAATTTQIEAMASLLGIDSSKILAANVTVSSALGVATITVDTKDLTIGNAGVVTMKVDSTTGACKELNGEKVTASDFLDSYGIDAKDFGPGDLFFIQQNVQIIKDMISTLQTSGKANADIMKEATQKYAQG